MVAAQDVLEDLEDGSRGPGVGAVVAAVLVIRVVEVEQLLVELDLVGGREVALEQLLDRLQLLRQMLIGLKCKGVILRFDSFFASNKISLSLGRLSECF